MSQENVEIVDAWWKAVAGWFNSPRDPEALSRIVNQYMAANVIYEEDPIWPDAGAFRGRDAVHRRFLEYADLMHIDDVSRAQVIDTGDSVLTEIRLEMLASDVGDAVAHPWAFTAEVGDGRIAHFRGWYDPDEAARAAGLSD
jgi:ketosteroid isomerase-like protein